MDELETIVANIEYNADPDIQRLTVLAEYLKYVKQNDLKLRAVVKKDSDGDIFCLYATDFEYRRYLWVDYYEDDLLSHTSLEYCTFDEILYSSDDMSYTFFNAFKSIDDRHEFVNVIDKLNQYIPQKSNIADNVSTHIIHGYLKLDEFVKNKTGKGLADRGIERNDANERERKEEPLKWATKRMLIGTIKGLLGAGFHGDLK